MIHNNNCIVLVDDSDVNILLMQRLITKSNLENEVLAFKSGPEFLEHMANTERGLTEMPALVVMDINMPRMSGFEVFKELRSMTGFGYVPMVRFFSKLRQFCRFCSVPAVQNHRARRIQ